MKNDVDDVESNDGSTEEQIVLTSETGGRHPVVRSMLLRTSDYFQGLVNSGMRDAHYRELTFQCLTNESLKEVRDYLSRLSTNEVEGRRPRLKSLNKVEAGLDGAFYLQINDMIDNYVEFLLKHLNMSTCIRILNIANKYVLTDQVIEKVFRYMLKNFKDIPESFKISLSPDEMFRLVASEEINADSEIDIFNLIIKWVSDDQTRKCFVEKLLTEVRYCLMTTAEKQECTAVLNDLKLNICHNKDKDSNISRTLGMLFAIGSTESKDQDGNFFNILRVYDFVEACKICDNSTAKPKPIRFNPSGRRGPPRDLDGYNACVVGNCLYLVGGKPRKTSITCKVSRYNPVTAAWSKCCSMNLARRQFYLGGLAGQLYAVAGVTANCSETPTVEKYTPSENRWYMVEPLPLALSHLAGCVWNGMIYVSGGWDDCRDVRNVVYRYDPSCNKWFPRAPMLTERRSHVMTCTGNKIFVFGGKKVTQNAMDGEMYDVENDQWSSVLKLKMPVCDSPSITINNCLYIFEHEFFSIYWFRKYIQKINLAKYLKEKKTSNDSSLSSVQGGNANNNNLEQNSHSDDDCQILSYKRQKDRIPFECQYVGVMIMSDI
ncbi:hypothetical protein HELRODRAFT_166087 [Helobdella robusta]|uniref:BACK domain-containing protein n=1 Tax=Helobdella robusta TaxID=6412 RepID=T1EXQ7_HELRO|nr:hypothetical protein HELRODRAFT_166087 [Helobdella robusta]ESN90421.1 hypothetical protein HELRODRAFT_166087 [Helobdella robusta]